MEKSLQRNEKARFAQFWACRITQHLFDTRNGYGTIIGTISTIIGTIGMRVSLGTIGTNTKWAQQRTGITTSGINKPWYHTFCLKILCQ